DPATFEGEFRVSTPHGYTLPAQKFSNRYYSSTGGTSRGLAIAGEDLGDVHSAAGLMVTLAPVQMAALPVQPGQIIVVQVVKPYDFGAGSVTSPIALPEPVTAYVDWWRL